MTTELTLDEFANLIRRYRGETTNPTGSGALAELLWPHIEAARPSIWEEAAQIAERLANGFSGLDGASAAHEIAATLRSKAQQ